MGGLTSGARIGSLPTDTTSFVGRKVDVGELKRLLSVARSVTLTGVGGVGKSRLALQVSSSLSRTFAHGAWLTELADVQEPALVARTVCEALAIPDETGRRPLDVLAEYLRDRELLLVLDNCDHLIDACAELVGAVLRAAPRVRILATSRERLRVDGEHVWQVSPLSLPDPAKPLPPGAGLRYPALSLFAERATAVEPSFAVTVDNQADVARVCHLLDGLPLAIELVAARLRALSLEHVLARLADCYWLVATGRRGGLARHHSLEAAVEWSFNLCGAQEQLLWARASVFAGGFDLAAAEQVCTGDGVTAAAIPDLVASLIDKSILVREEQPGQARFRMLETLRHFGRHRLRADDREIAYQRRHRDHYLAVAQRHEAGWISPRQSEIMMDTRVEQANIRAALDFCLGHADEQRVGLHLAGTLWYAWAGCGMLGEGRHWLDRALALHPMPCRERAKALWVNGNVATLQGDLPAAAAMLEECLSYAREAGDDVALACATHRLGSTMLVSDRLAEAMNLYEDARRRYLELDGVDSGLILTRIELAVVALFLGDHDRAEALSEESRAFAEERGDRWARAYAIYVLALIAFGRGRYRQADAHGRDCLRIKHTLNDLLGMVLAIEVLAWTAAADGAPERAATLLGAADRIWPSVGDPLFGARHLVAPRGQCEAQVRDSLGDSAFEAARRRGAELCVTEAVAYALGERTTPAAPATGEPAAAEISLTPREREVAELIAKGLSNKEIADSLVISQRTAEGHVDHILKKLGFTSRGHVAAWIAGVTGVNQ